VKVVGSLILVALLIGFGSQSPASASSGTTVRASEARGGQDATRNSSWPSVSDDGRFVAFSSWASNLVPHDLKDSSDIFIRDLLTSTTTRVSVDSNGSEANGSSFTPSISADGNVVAFRSDATNLVASDTEGHTDVFVHTISTGSTVRASQRPSEVGADRDSSEPAISANGHVVAFSSQARNLVGVRVNVTGLCCDIYVHNLATGHNRLGDPMQNGHGASDSFGPVLSATGRYLAFGSGMWHRRGRGVSGREQRLRAGHKDACDDARHTGVSG
jgi:Tol biopolymer transport system component